MNKKIRVRFAPSPTGPLHMGGVRTALFNYLFAKQNGGDFLLRIEDTDQNRYVEGAEEYINQALAWCGIKIDEGVKEGGNFAPYRQSDRKELYKKYAEILINSGNAYYAFDTAEDLEKMRKRLEEEKSSVRLYNRQTRMQMKNSFTLSAEELEKRINSGEKYVVRFNMPEDEKIEVKDMIRGKVVFDSSLLDDKVLYKSDGMPTYHLANIVDDKLMEISHVIRGEEWLPSLPLHVLLYRSLGWENDMPKFAHLSLLLKPNGKGKLSKRDGDKMGFPVFPLQWTDPKNGEISRGYKEDGYLPEAFVNIIALLGWNPGTEQEIMDINELIKNFDIYKVVKSGAKFDPEKAKWFNKQYISKLSDKKLAEIFTEKFEVQIGKAKQEYIQKVCSLVKERISLTGDFWTQASFFFEAPTEYDKKIVKKRWKEDTSEFMSQIIMLINKIGEADFVSINIENSIKEHIEKNELNFGKILNPLRLTLTGGGGGPHIFDIMETIGKLETVKRIETAIEKLQN